MNIASKPVGGTATEITARRSVGGLLTFLVTPLTKDQSIDERRLCSLADEQIAAGVDTLTLFGSTGAIGSFTEEERKRAAEVLVKHVAGRIPVMIGTGAISTAEAVRLAEHAERIGADAILVVPISYWILNDSELQAHYTTIAQSVKIPLCIYNNPGLTGIDIKPHLIAQLAKIANVYGVKESSPELARISQTKRLVGDRLKVFAGRDNSAFEGLRLGADGWASGAANIVPSACRSILELSRDPLRMNDMRAEWVRYHPLLDFCISKGLIRACYSAMDILGRPVGSPRRPLMALPADERAQLEKLIRDLGVK
jgi:4-hydroxy-tetrahydrodipicolinate synthase